MRMTDIGSYITAKFSHIVKPIVAAAASDAAATAGEIIDRFNYQSAVLSIPYKAVLADTKTASLKVEIQESADGETFDTAVTLFDGVLCTGSTGGTTFKSNKELALNLDGYKRYFKVTTTMDLSAAATDTAEYAVNVILGGSAFLPV